MRAWARAKATGNMVSLATFYAFDFQAEGKNFAAHEVLLKADSQSLGRRPLDLKDLSILDWSEDAEVRVVTFGEVAAGTKTGKQTRQYWEQRAGSWKIVYETELR